MGSVVTLKSFVGMVGGQKKAASILSGTTQAAISKAIKLDRKIFIEVDGNGDVISSYEVSDFPNRNHLKTKTSATCDS